MGNNFYDNQNAQAPNVALVGSLYGDPVDGKLGVPSGGDIQPAMQHWSTAPYVPDKRRAKDNGQVLCSHEGCRAYPSKRTDPYCVGHGISMGLIPHPRKDKPGAWPTETEVVDGDPG